MLQVPKRALAFACDMMAALASFVIAYAAHVDKFPLPNEDLLILSVGGVLFLAVSAGIFQCVQLDRAIWRYCSLPDLIRIGAAATAIGVIFTLIMLTLFPHWETSVAVALTNWFILVIFLSGPRIAYRLFKTRAGTPAGVSTRRWIPVLLIGSGDAAAAFIRYLHNDPNAAYRAVGVLELHRNGNLGRAIAGVPVLGSVDELAAVKARLGSEGLAPQRLIICDKTTAFDRDLVRKLVGEAETLALKVERLPTLTDFKTPCCDGELELQPVSVEDLLGRPQVALDLQAIDRLLRGRKILITGAGGSIGSELVRQIAHFSPSQLLLLDSSEYSLFMIGTEMAESYPAVPRQTLLCDVRDRRRVHRLFKQYRPEVVFHAAALKHVPMVELNPSQGVATNALGTRNVADATAAFGTLAMVLISTDKAVAPASMMGASKRLAELYCQALDSSSDVRSRPVGPRFMIVRFGNVLGSSGSVVPLFQRQLARGGPLTVTHPDVDRYFMTIREAVSLVLQASAHGIGQRDGFGRIFVLDMGEPIKIVELARQIIRLSGLRPDLDVKLEYTGLRPGERLHEQLFDDNEYYTASNILGVLTATSSPPSHGLLNEFFDDLEALVIEDEGSAVRSAVKEAISAFAKSASHDEITGAANGTASKVLPALERPNALLPEFAAMQEGW